MKQEKVVIAGAGPAGLTAGYELLKRSDKYKVIILEETSEIGGLSRTVIHNGNRIDIGGHRFYSKYDTVNKWWNEIFKEKPEEMMIRDRSSRIFFNGKFYDYPVTVNFNTVKNLGFLKTVRCIFSYIKTKIKKLPEDNLENFYINRFGKYLYELFFEYYTENLWGRHPKDIDASWGEQRIKGLSMIEVLKHATYRVFHIKEDTETSLIEQFKYPRLGPGELWEAVADKIIDMGGEIRLNTKAENVFIKDNRISAIQPQKGLKIRNIDYFISSMPIKDLIYSMNDVPRNINLIAAGLPYRDYMTLGILIDEKSINNNIHLTDNWIYVQDRHVKLGRIQIYNNWSPYLVKSDGIWLGLEYFVCEGDKYWDMSDAEFCNMAVDELKAISFIYDDADIKDTHLIRVKKAYPAYFDSYNKIDDIKEYLDKTENLYCIGRNGQHRYNNMDHSMCTAFETVDNIINGRKDKNNIWSVNTETNYSEQNDG